MSETTTGTTTTSTGRCFAPTAPPNPPLIQHGNLTFQARHVGWIVAGFFTIVSTITSLWLVNKHLQWYTKKREQRYIVRLLFLVPIYATVSLASYIFWDHATALTLIRDCYESTVLTAFFYLLLQYLSPSDDEQRTIFLKVGLSKAADREARKKGEPLKKWMFPLNFVKKKPGDGLYFLQMMKWGVLQYCVIRPITTLAAVLLNYVGLYCEQSLSPAWGHVYITVIVSISVSIAMYCLIQLYVPIAPYLKPYSPLLKLFAVKAVVFLTFWQATGLSVLSFFGIVKDEQYATAGDINVGIGALLETFEMMLFGFLHLRAFSYKPYRPHPTPGEPPILKTNRLKSLGHAFDFRETFREIWDGWIYLIDRSKGREPRPDMGARRAVHLEAAFGRGREGSKLLVEEVETEKKQNSRFADRGGEPGKVDIDVEVIVEDDQGKRIWLDLPYDHTRGRSDAFETQVQQELQRRGLGQGDDQGHDLEANHKPQRSWWRGIYERMSHSTPHNGDDDQLSPGPTRRSTRRVRSRNPSRDIDQRSLLHGMEYEDLPPASVMQNYRQGRERRESAEHAHHRSNTDILAPLAVFQQRQQQQARVPPQQRGLPSLPTSDQGSTLSVPVAQVGRNDSLLNRIFSHVSSSSEHGNESQTPSSQAHGITVSQVRGYRRGSGMAAYDDNRPLPPPPIEATVGHISEESPVDKAQDQPSHNAILVEEAPQADGSVSDTGFETASTTSFHRRESARIHRSPSPPSPPSLPLQSPPRPSVHRRESAGHAPPVDAVVAPSAPVIEPQRSESKNQPQPARSFLIPRKAPPPLFPVAQAPSSNPFSSPPSSPGSPTFPNGFGAADPSRNWSSPHAANQWPRPIDPPFVPPPRSPSPQWSPLPPSSQLPRIAPNPAVPQQPRTAANSAVHSISSRQSEERFILQPTRPSRPYRRTSTPLNAPIQPPSRVPPLQRPRHSSDSSRRSAVPSVQRPIHDDYPARYPDLSPPSSPQRSPPRRSSNYSRFPAPVMPALLASSSPQNHIRNTDNRYPSVEHLQHSVPNNFPPASYSPRESFLR